MRKKKPNGVNPSHASLKNYMRAKVRANCLICQLSPEIRAQLGRAATDRGFSRTDQAEWLRTAVGASEVTLEILAQHLGRGHDRDVEVPNAAQA
jgi:hypothetical protein